MYNGYICPIYILVTDYLSRNKKYFLNIYIMLYAYYVYIA